jgi:hypothetical protein
MPGRPASPLALLAPPLHNPTTAPDQTAASAALSPCSGPVAREPRMPRASPAFPTEGEQARAVPRTCLHGIMSTSLCATPSEAKPTRVKQTSPASHARALKTAHFRAHRFTLDQTSYITAPRPQRRPERAAPLPNP